MPKGLSKVEKLEAKLKTLEAAYKQAKLARSAANKAYLKASTKESKLCDQIDTVETEIFWIAEHKRRAQ